MDSIDSLLERILDDPLSIAREADNPVGYIGLDLPLDIRHASPRQFCHLPWNKNRKTPNADKWLESAFPGWARSILEDWMAGTFDFFDMVIFSRGDDVVQRLYYYICEMQTRGVTGGPRPVIFDLATIPRRSSVCHTRHAVGKLLTHLELKADDLEKGIARANAYREFYALLNLDRQASGVIYENIARADLFCDLMPALKKLSLPEMPASHRLVLAGSVPPDDSFYRAVETVGWNVVGETHQRSLTRYGLPVEVIGRHPLEVVAQHANDCTFGPRAFGDRSRLLLDEIIGCRAEAVILWLTEEDEALAWDVAGQCRALERQGIPHLLLPRRRWDGSDDAAGEITRFLQELDV